MARSGGELSIFMQHTCNVQSILQPYLDNAFQSLQLKGGSNWLDTILGALLFTENYEFHATNHKDAQNDINKIVLSWKHIFLKITIALFGGKTCIHH